MGDHSMKDLVSVVVVNWNGKKWLSTCLSSLFAQTYSPLEIIVVDNGSTDGSKEFLVSHFPEVRVIARAQNGGFGVGNTEGIIAAKGAFILLLNTDTWIEPTFVAEMYDYFIRHHYDLLGPRQVGYEEGSDVPAVRMSVDMFGHPVSLRTNIEKPHFYLHGMCLFFRKDFYQETGGFDPAFFMYCEDVDWCWRLHLLGKRIGYISSLVVHHAKIEAPLRYSPQVFFWRNSYTLRMLLKNYSGGLLFLIIPLYFIENMLEMIGLIFLLHPNLIASYIRAWWDVLFDLASLLSARRWVQSRRKVSDKELGALMYHGLGVLRHFFAG